MLGALYSSPTLPLANGRVGGGKQLALSTGMSPRIKEHRRHPQVVVPPRNPRASEQDRRARRTTGKAAQSDRYERSGAKGRSGQTGVFRAGVGDSSSLGWGDAAVGSAAADIAGSSAADVAGLDLELSSLGESLIASNAGVIDRQQGIVRLPGRSAVVQFNRQLPSRVGSASQTQQLAQSAPVQFRPVPQSGGPLRLSMSGPLSELNISPNLLTAGALNDSEAARFYSAVGRAKAIENYLEHGGHLVFQSEGSPSVDVAYYFPRTTGGPNGLFSDEFQRLTEANPNGARFSEDGSDISKADRDALEAIKKNAEAEAVGVLSGKKDLLLPDAVTPFLDDLGNSILFPKLPPSEPPPQGTSAWSAAVAEAFAFNEAADKEEYPQFMIPRLVNGSISKDIVNPSAVPLDPLTLSNAGLSTLPDEILARGLTKEMTVRAFDRNKQDQTAENARFTIVQGEGVNQELKTYWPYEIKALYDAEEIDDADLSRVGLSRSPNGQLAKTLEVQNRQDAQRANADVLERDQPVLSYVTGEGFDSELVTEWPTTIRSKVRSGALDGDALKEAGLSTDDNGLLAAALKRELSGVSRNFNSSALEKAPPRLAIVTGKGLDQEAELRRPTDVQYLADTGRLTDSDLALLGLSKAEGGILEESVKKEHLDDILTETSPAADELVRVMSNPDSDSGALVREAIEDGHGERLKRYVGANGTDGIGSFARTLLDGKIHGGKEPPIGGPRPVAAGDGEPEPNLDTLTQEFRQRNFLKKTDDPMHDRRHVLLGLSPNRQGEAQINAAENTFLKEAMQTDLSPEMFSQASMQRHLNDFRTRIQANLDNSRARVDSALAQDKSVEALHKDVSAVMNEEGVRTVKDRSFAETQLALDDIKKMAGNDAARYRYEVNKLLDAAYTPPSDASIKQQFADSMSYMKALREANPNLSIRQLFDDPAVGAQVKFPMQSQVDAIRFGDGQTQGLYDRVDALQ